MPSPQWSTARFSVKNTGNEPSEWDAHRFGSLSLAQMLIEAARSKLGNFGADRSSTRICPADAAGHRGTRGPSRHLTWADALELATSVADLDAPVHTALARVDVLRPSGQFGLQRLQIAHLPTTQALPCHRTEFVLLNVQPTAVLRRVASLNAPHSFQARGRVAPAAEVGSTTSVL